MPSNPKHLLDLFEITPKRSLGQNFLHDPNALEKIVTAAELLPDDIVLEIGAGTGALTQHLAAAVMRVVALEVDDRLLPVLHRELEDYPNVQIVHADILEVDLNKYIDPKDDYHVVANLPYYITSAILRRLLEHEHKPGKLVFTIQQEVADRLAAQPGDMNLLSVSVQYYGQPHIVTRFNPAAFWPRPEVTSAVVRIDVYDTPPVPVTDDAAFFRVVRAGFSQKRKQLRNAISGGLQIKKQQAAEVITAAGVDPRRRAETLTLEEWAAITQAVRAAEV